MTKPLTVIFAFLLVCLSTFGLADGEATWSAKLDRADVRAGEFARVVISAKLKEGWHTYSIVPVPEGPFPTTIQSPIGDGIESAGKIEEQAPKVELDPNFEKKVGLFSGSAEFYAPIKIKAGKTGDQKLSIRLKFEVCDAQNCIPPAPIELPVSFAIQPGEARPEFLKLAPLSSPPPIAEQGPVDAAAAQIADAEKKGLLSVVFLAFAFGFLSLVTPCVFPMIPITVSFFAKQKTEGDKLDYKGPIAYCLGIIGTFTGLGVLIGSTGLNRIATNLWVNIALSLLFIVLAANLFGVYELRLPSWLVNSASKKSRAGGILGPLAMGLTFTLTSFTCTVPFVGTLLIQSARGGLLHTIVGMLAYSTAFALPFFLLALFPSFLQKLPRSGAWLVTVKAFMGFLELMAALKFVSNVDLSLRLAWLTRPVFLAVWAATALIGGLYLLGWVRLPHDPGDRVGWIRRGFGIATVALAAFCLAGLNGMNLKILEAFPPPDPYPYLAAGSTPKPAKDSLVWEKNYESALRTAKASGKNVFIDFTGIFCTNCRLIEKSVFTRPEVQHELEKFVLTQLYTDDGSSENDANQKLEIQMAGVNTLPLYVVVSPDGKVLKIHQQQPPLEDAERFLNAIKPYTGGVVASR